MFLLYNEAVKTILIYMKALLLVIIAFLFLTPLFIESNKAETKAPMGINQIESEIKTTIKEHCQSEWPDDEKMKAYCEQLQYEGIETLNQGKPENISDSEFNVIHDECEKEWPTDYQMRAFCEKKQYEGIETLNQGKPENISDSEFDIIRYQCEKEWPTDYQMRAFCEKKQHEERMMNP